MLRVHKRVATGVHAVEVSNRIGKGVLPGAVVVAPPGTTSVVAAWPVVVGSLCRGNGGNGDRCTDTGADQAKK